MMKTRKTSVSVDLSMYHSMIKVRAENKVLLPSHDVSQVLSYSLSAAEEVAELDLQNPGSPLALGFQPRLPSHVSVAVTVLYHASVFQDVRVC
jgi:hypothetical protein